MSDTGWKHYLTLRGSRAQACIQQSRAVPNQFRIEAQFQGGRSGEIHRFYDAFANWNAYNLAYALAHRSVGAVGSRRYVDRRIQDIGF